MSEEIGQISVDQQPAPEAGANAAVEKALLAQGIIRRNAYLSLVAGVIPLAFVDTIALIAVQMKMLSELSALHGVEFRGHLGKSAVGSLLSSIVPNTLAGGLVGTRVFRSIVGGIPVIGPVLRLAAFPAFDAAFTYAIGKVFHQHFASGGTFLTFDPIKVQNHFKEQFEAAKKLNLTQDQPLAA